MLSMTSYARIDTIISHFQLILEIKSLNSRFLDVYIECPDCLSFYEYNFRKFIVSKISRGNVKIKILIQNLKSKEEIEIDWTKISGYNKFYSKLIENFKLQDKVQLSHFIHDRIFQIEDKINLEDYSNLLNDILKKVFFSFMKGKKDEGKEIHKIIKEFLDLIKNYIKRIESISSNVLETNILKLKKRIKNLLTNDFDEQRILMEVAILTNRLDFSEEIKRFSFHIEQFYIISDKEEVVGKKLEFLTQEMFREINTLSVKANNLDISLLTVEIKHLIEQIKEQLRNIE